MGQLKNLKEDVGHPRSLVIRLQIMDGPDEKDRVLVGEFPPRYESPIAKFVHRWPLCSNICLRGCPCTRRMIIDG